jgi:hypothetical protein
MGEPVRRSRAMASGIAKGLIPNSRAGIWALTRGAQLISMLPARVTKAIARLNTKTVRLYDTMHYKEYSAP